MPPPPRLQNRAPCACARALARTRGSGDQVPAAARSCASPSISTSLPPTPASRPCRLSLLPHSTPFPNSSRARCRTLGSRLPAGPRRSLPPVRACKRIRGAGGTNLSRPPLTREKLRCVCAGPACDSRSARARAPKARVRRGPRGACTAHIRLPGLRTPRMRVRGGLEVGHSRWLRARMRGTGSGREREKALGCACAERLGRRARPGACVRGPAGAGGRGRARASSPPPPARERRHNGGALASPAACHPPTL